MNNVVYFRELMAAGATTAAIKTALGCCLLKLGPGIYSVLKKCAKVPHRVFAPLAVDTAWVDYHAQKKHLEQSQRAKYADHLDRLLILHYESYRADDVVWSISAARVHRLRTFGQKMPRLETLNARASSSTSVMHRRLRSIPAEDWALIGGVKATTPIRTSFDLVREFGAKEGFPAIEHALRRMLLGSDEDAIFKNGYPPDIIDQSARAIDTDFIPVMNRLTRRRERIRKLLEIASPLSETYPESRASLNLHMLGLHDFAQQVKIYDGGRLLTIVDFLCEEAKVVLYVDGTQKYVDHGADVIKKEMRQHNRLLATGYTVVRFSFAEALSLATFSRKLFEQAPQLRALCRAKLHL